MASCPRCGTNLKDEYGMSQCPGCGAFSFVDMNGDARVQETEPVPLDVPETGSDDVAVFDYGSVSEDYAEPSEFSQEPGGVASSSDFSDPIESLIEPIKSAAPQAPQGFGPVDDPLNINEFANSEMSAAKDGPLLFRVLISGIDTREIRESIREVLQDPRFAWDANEIFAKISKGHLAINGLSPVKASILVTRFKRLPVQIRWEQYAIAQGQQP